jgi:hypothetical protein
MISKLYRYCLALAMVALICISTVPGCLLVCNSQSNAAPKHQEPVRPAHPFPPRKNAKV